MNLHRLWSTLHEFQSDTSQRRLGPLLPEEKLTQASQAWIHNCQQTAFADEFTNLQSNNAKVRCLLLVQQFCVFLDNKNIICCRGRIHKCTSLQKHSPATKGTPYWLFILHISNNCIQPSTAQLQHWDRNSGFLLPGNWSDNCFGNACELSQDDGKALFAVKENGWTSREPWMYVNNLQRENKMYICLFTCWLLKQSTWRWWAT